MNRLTAGMLAMAWFIVASGWLTPTFLSTQPRTDIEVLSKDDARLVFSMSRAQWTENVRHAVAAGQAQALGRIEDGLRMATQTPEGDILMVQPDYFQGDAKPAVIHVTVGYRLPRARQFTEPMIKDVIAAAQRQMAPEFEVIGRHERVDQGLMFFFSITERRP